MDRVEWLAEVMRRKLERFDTVYAPTYDEGWGAIPDSHRAYVSQVVESVPVGGLVLDAACGTGRFFPIVLDAGRRVVGVDWSVGMLAEARAKHPDVQVEKRRLQDLRFDEDFDAVFCVDALENLPPEDWPSALTGLRRAAKPGRPVYLTVELSESAGHLDAANTAAAARGWPIEGGELVTAENYHFYPDRDQVRRWLIGAGLQPGDASDADGYWHLLCRAAPEPGGE